MERGASIRSGRTPALLLRKRRDSPGRIPAADRLGDRQQRSDLRGGLVQSTRPGVPVLRAQPGPRQGEAMRRIFSVLYAATVAILLSITASAQINADLLGEHNLSGASGASVTSQGSLGCTFCHAPHSGIGANTPLWNQKLSQQTYTPYNSTTYHQQGNTQPTLGVTSSLCLSCHDGTVAVGQSAAYGPLPVTGQRKSADSFGTTLTGSHPGSLATPLKDASSLLASLPS